MSSGTDGFPLAPGPGECRTQRVQRPGGDDWRGMSVSWQLDGRQTRVADVEQRTQRVRQVDFAGAELEMLVYAGDHVVELHVGEQGTGLVDAVGDRARLVADAMTDVQG